MLRPDATAALARKVVAFLNSRLTDARQVELLVAPSNTEPFPMEQRSLRHYEWVQQMATRALRAGPRRPRKQRSSPVRGSASPPGRRRRLALEREWRRRAIERLLLELTTSAVSAPHPEYPWTTLQGRLRFDGAGRLAVEEPRFRTVGDVVAITLAELESPDATAEIRLCGFGGCDQFFWRPRGKAGKPRLYCSNRCKNLCSKLENR